MVAGKVAVLDGHLSTTLEIQDVLAHKEHRHTLDFMVPVRDTDRLDAVDLASLSAISDENPTLRPELSCDSLRPIDEGLPVSSCSSGSVAASNRARLTGLAAWLLFQNTHKSVER